MSGIEGNFRSCCEAVMGMLRHNDDSVMAMLEAFVHDPLINCAFGLNSNHLGALHPFLHIVCRAAAR